MGKLTERLVSLATEQKIDEQAMARQREEQARKEEEELKRAETILNGLGSQMERHANNGGWYVKVMDLDYHFSDPKKVDDEYKYTLNVRPFLQGSAAIVYDGIKEMDPDLVISLQKEPDADPDNSFGFRLSLAVAWPIKK
jgi:hypothetical protein